MTNNPTSKETRTDHARDGSPVIRFQDLPWDVLYTIVSKLTPKEFARTSVLSSRWKCMWSTCPRLTFDGVAVYKCNRAYLRQDTDKFIHEVTAVLQKHCGMKVQTLEVRIDFVDSKLVDHLNNLVAFAVSSRTKNLTLDLKPDKFWEYNTSYEFPFQLLNSASVSCLQQMQLSFVSLKLPSRFKGFPNLRKLHIQAVHASRKDLEYLLSNSCNLEWLKIDRCDLNDELIVDGLLAHLRYLHVECCKITKIKLHALNLATFQYEGAFVPIDLSYSSMLQNAYINYRKAFFSKLSLLFSKGFPTCKI